MVTFAEEILNGKLHFLCSVICLLLWHVFYTYSTQITIYMSPLKYFETENPAVVKTFSCSYIELDQFFINVWSWYGRGQANSVNAGEQDV